MSMLNHFFDYKPEVLALDEKALELCQPYFKQMEDIRDYNQLKMLKAFADTQMSSTDMLGTTGYGLWDSGRAKLEQIFAEVMGAEDALVRSQFQSGTHTLAVALFGLLRAGDTLLAATGRPYDTLEGVIGLDGKGKGTGTLMDYGIKYDEAPLNADFTPDYELIAQKAPGAKVCHIQRSRGYLQRNAFDLDTIRKVADTARAANPDIIIFVDNCYGEFTQKEEPCQAGADLVVGSLIKNPGGGIAPTGGYIAGRKDLVELCAYRLNAPGLGKELGCTLETPRDMYLGFYYAPGVVCEAIKTAIYAQCLLELVGKKPIPRYCEAHNDIVTCFDAGTADALIGFCRGVQAASPVDSYAAPEPSPEPGYTDEVIMASGSFTQGSTIELSCDGPLREPYTCYLQGGLNFAASRAGVLLAVQNAYFKLTLSDKACRLCQLSRRESPWQAGFESGLRLRLQRHLGLAAKGSNKETEAEMPQLSDRVGTFTDSVIRRMTRINNQYDSINLSQGFPDFDPPKELTDALAKAAHDGPHQYAVTFGAQNFREALAKKTSPALHHEVDPNTEICVTCGGTEAMMAAMMTICNPGDNAHV